MRKDISCAFCKTAGDGSGPGYHGTKFLLAVRPNTRVLYKGWVCRECLDKYSDLDDRDFLNRFAKAIRQKS